MDIAAALVRRVVYPIWEAKNGTAKLRHLREFEQFQFASPERVRERQWSEFREIVTHAFRSCPFYRAKFTAAGFTPADLRTPDDVWRIPTTSKQEIQEHLSEMLAEGVAQDQIIRDMTGGSTGRPMVVYYDRQRFDRRVAATIRHNRWAGWDIGDKVAAVWGATRDVRQASLSARVRNRVINRQLILDASAIDDARMGEFARTLVRYKPKAMLGYANALGLFARFVIAEGISGIRPRGIVSSAEVLTERDRADIERAFGCPVFDRYGSRELGIIASECEAHRGMHVNAEDLFVEVLTGGRPVVVGETGDIVITDVRNRVMPMIRYRTMDLGRAAEHPCSCGRGLPLIELAGGRVTDFLVSAAGQKVSGIVLATYVITDVEGVGQVQFVQRARDAVLVRIVKGGGWSDHSQQRLIRRVRDYLGDEMQVQVEFTPAIPLEASGKYRFSISELPA
jgi:phenylacetate-CoA ligase